MQYLTSLCKDIINEWVNIQTHFISITPGVASVPDNDNHSKSFGTSTNRSERNEDHCTQSVKNGTMSVFYIKNRNVLFTMLKYNGSPGRVENHTEQFLFSAKPHGDSPGRRKSYSVHSNCRIHEAKVSLMRAYPSHFIVTNSNSQDGMGKGP